MTVTTKVLKTTKLTRWTKISSWATPLRTTLCPLPSSTILMSSTRVNLKMVTLMEIMMTTVMKINHLQKNPLAKNKILTLVALNH